MASESIAAASQNMTHTRLTFLDACRLGKHQLVQQLISEYSASCDDDGNTGLHLAAMHGHLAVVETLASRSSLPPPGKNKEGKTPLHLLCTIGYAALLKRLDPSHYDSQYTIALNAIANTVTLLLSKLECSSDIKRICDGVILHQACHCGNIELVRTLLSEKCSDPMARDSQGFTPLHIAALGGSEEVTTELIENYKCPIDCVESLHGQIPLYFACGSGNVDLVRKFISEYGSDPMARDSEGNTPLHVAALCGREEVVRELVDRYKCPVDCVGSQDGQTILHDACTSGNVDLVRILISEYGSDPMARDSEGDTPLHVAALGGREEVVRELLDRYKCPVDCVSALGRTVLHNACESGNVDLVRILISEYGSDPMARDSKGDTPLHVAALGGREEVVRELVDRYKCPVDCVGSHYGQTILHDACASDNVDLVRILISEYGSDPMASDSKGDTPLHVAALGGREEVVRELVDRYRCPVDCVGALGRTVLHKACQSGNVDLVKILISEYGSNPVARDSEGDTPLHVATLGGREEVVRELLDRYKCPVDCVDALGRTVLHCACNRGNVDLVKILISEYGSDPMARDSEGDTPLHVAALCGREEVVRELVDRYKCPVDCVGSQDGQTILHDACTSGNVDLVRILISEYGSDPMARDNEGDTPLHVAALGGIEEVVRELLDRYKCPVDCVDALGRTVLHGACQSGNVDLVRILISEYGSDPMARDSEGETSLHVAALGGREEVVRELVYRYKCPVDCVGAFGRTILYYACQSGNVDLVRILISEYGSDPMARDSKGRTPLHTDHAVDPMCVDDDGNTALHIAALCNKIEIVKTLTNVFQCFPCIRNKQGKTPYDLAVEKNSDECINGLASYAEATTVSVLPKVLVAGSKFSGKTTLVKALKISTDACIDFAAYSCGIQLIHLSSSIGEVAFFELPCEPAQAAVVEIMTATSSCSAIVVVNVSKGRQKASEELGYWLSFLSYSCKLNQAPLRVTVVGSHADTLVPSLKIDAQEMLGQVCNEVSQSFYCANVKITGSIAIEYDGVPILATVHTTAAVHTLKYHLEEMIALASADCPADISNGAIYLLKLLQKELKVKSMCQLSVVSDLVIRKHFYPEEEQTELLLIYLRELETHGFLRVVGDNKSLIVNIIPFLSTLSSEITEIALVHGASEAPSVQGFGIVTEENFGTLFPNDIPNISEYLSQLQLCVDIADPRCLIRPISLELLQSPVQQIGENSRCIFFPSCIFTESVHCQKWIKLRDKVFCQGFFLKATEKYQYLPSRFFHLLLLRVAFVFVFPSSSRMSQLGVERCAIWKNGIQWLTINGIEMYVELVEEQTGIVVAGRSDQAQEWACENMLSDVMEDILEAKSEFMKLDIYLIDPVDLKQDSIPGSNTMHLFDMTEIQNALVRKYESVPSVDRSTVLPSSQILQMQKYTLWSKFYSLFSGIF